MGWTEDMDIDNTMRKFYREVRKTVVIWGRVTPIRVQNIEVRAKRATVREQIVLLP